MWLATRSGFYSIVCKNSAWHVRARMKRDLFAVCDALRLPRSAVQCWPGADYMWRLVIDRDQIDVLFIWLASTITYNNFKNEIAGSASQRDKLPAYHDLWHGLHRIQEKE